MTKKSNRTSRAPKKAYVPTDFLDLRGKNGPRKIPVGAAAIGFSDLRPPD